MHFAVPVLFLAAAAYAQTQPQAARHEKRIAEATKPD
jgi:hypothetical protein